MTFQAQQSSLACQTFVDRALKVAEGLLNIQKYLKTSKVRDLYRQEKEAILSRMNRRLKSCPSLKCSGWTLIGILIVDACIMRQNVLPNGSFDEWGIKVEAIAAGALGGGRIANSLLREEDMSILRTFFCKRTV